MKNILWLSTDRVIKICGNFIIFLLLAKHFNLIDFGRLTLFLAVVATIGPLISFGQYQTLVKLLKDNTREASNYVIASTLFLSASLTISCLLYIIIFRFIEHNYIIFSVLAVLFTSNVYMQIIRAWSDADQASRQYLRIELTIFIIFFLIKILAIKLDSGVVQILSVIAIEQLVLSVTCYITYFSLSLNFILPRKLLFINLAKQSFPLMMTALTVSLYMRIDQFMLLRLINVESVAIYAFYTRFFEAGYIPLTILGTHYAPAINNHVKNSLPRAGLIRILYQLMFVGCVITMLGIIVFTSVQSQIVPQDYKGYEFLFYYGTSLIPCIAIGIFSSQLLVANDYKKSLVYRSLVAILLNILLNFVLIPVYGIAGALYASIATQISVTFIATLLHKPTMNLLFQK